MDATYVSNNSFKVVGNTTVDFTAGRRVKMDCGLDGTKYASIVSSSYFSPYTTVVIDETDLTASLTSVLYGVIQMGPTGTLPDHSHDGGEGTGGTIAASGKSEFIDLLDTPTTYSGAEGQFVRVGATASGVEFAFVPVSGTDDHTHVAYVPWDFGAGTISGTGDIYCNDIYTSSGTVYIGDVQLTTSGGSLLIDGQTYSNGTDGSIWIVASGTPNNEFGNPHDSYLNQINYDIYQQQDVGIIYETTKINTESMIHDESTAFQGPPSNVSDGSDGTYWQQTITTNQWVSIDLAADTQIYKVLIRGLIANRMPKNFRVEASTNNSDWDIIYTGLTAQNVGPQEFTFGSISDAYRYWRIYIVDNWGDGYLNITRFELYPVTYTESFEWVYTGNIKGTDGDAATTFSGLTDTPDVYDEGKYLRSTVSGTEWAAIDIPTFSGTWVESDYITDMLVKEWNLTSSGINETFDWDGETEDVVIEYSYDKESGSTGEFIIRPNSDSGANYITNQILSNDSDTVTGSHSDPVGWNGMIVGGTGNTSALNFRGKFQALLKKGNSYRTCWMEVQRSDSLYNIRQTNAWKNTADAVTSIQVVMNGSSNGWVKLYKRAKMMLPVASGTGGGGTSDVQSFTDLDDTPSTYSGTDGQYLVSTGSGVDFSPYNINSVDTDYYSLELVETITVTSGVLNTTISGIQGDTYGDWFIDFNFKAEITSGDIRLGARLNNDNGAAAYAYDWISRNSGNINEGTISSTGMEFGYANTTNGNSPKIAGSSHFYLDQPRKHQISNLSIAGNDAAADYRMLRYQSYWQTEDVEVNSITLYTTQMITGVIKLYKRINVSLPIYEPDYIDTNIYVNELVQEWNLDNEGMDQTFTWDGDVDDVIIFEAVNTEVPTGSNVKIRFNNDTGTNYEMGTLTQDGTVAQGNTQTGLTFNYITNSSNSVGTSRTSYYLKNTGQKRAGFGEKATQRTDNTDNWWTGTVGHFWNNTVDKITSFRLWTDNTDVTGTFRLYKRVNLKLPVSSGTGGGTSDVQSFLDLTDTPSTYSGTDGRYAYSTGSGIAFGGAMGQSSVFEAYNSANLNSIDATATTVNIDTVRKNSDVSVFDFDNVGYALTVNKAGTYEITFRVSSNNQEATDVRTNSYAWLELNTGAGYAIVPGSYGHMYNRINPEGRSSCTVNAALDLNVGDLLRVRMKRNTGSNLLNTIAGGCNILVKELLGVKGEPGTPGESAITWYHGNTPQNDFGEINDFYLRESDKAVWLKQSGWSENSPAANTVHNIGSNYEGTDGFSVAGAPTDNGDYYTFDGIDDGLYRGADYGDESAMDIKVKFRIHNKNKDDYQILWKSGGSTYGIAVGLDDSNNLGLYCCNNDIGSSISFNNTQFSENVWYILYASTTGVIAILEADTGNFIAKTGSVLSGNGSNVECIGYAYDPSAMIPGDLVSGPKQWFDGDIDYVEIYSEGSLDIPTLSGTGSWEFQGYLATTSGGGGGTSDVQTFLDLTDTPTSYSGTDGQIMVSTGSGIEFSPYSINSVDTEIVADTLVKEWAITTSGIDETFSWDGENDEVIIEYAFDKDTSPTWLRIYPNNDTTSSNYNLLQLYGTTSNDEITDYQSPSTVTGLLCGGSGGSTDLQFRGSFRADLRKAAGVVRRSVHNCYRSDTSRFYTMQCEWTDTTSTVTSIRLTMDEGASGWIKLYKRAAISLPVSSGTGGGTSDVQTFLDLTDTPTTYSGTDGQIMVSTGSGIDWTAISSAPAEGNWILVATIEADDETFSESIPWDGDTYPRARIESVWSECVTAIDDITLRFNNDSASNYDAGFIAQNGSVSNAGYVNTTHCRYALGSAAGSRQIFATTDLYLKTGQRRFVYTQDTIYDSADTDRVASIYSNTWSNTVDNVTSINIAAANNCTGTIKIYRWRDITDIPVVKGKQSLQVEYATASGIYINPGEIHMANSTFGMYELNDRTEVTVSGLEADTWYYVYTSVSGSTATLGSSNFTVSSGVPTIDYPNLGYYFGDDRCIGFILTDNSGDIYRYDAVRGEYLFRPDILDYTYNTFSSVDITHSVPLGDLIVKIKVINSGDKRLDLNTTGDSSNIWTEMATAGVKNNFELCFFCSSSKQITYSTDTGTTSASIATRGFTIPDYIYTGA